MVGICAIYHFKTLVLDRDCFIQFKLLHRVYYTLARLDKISSSSSAECRRCTSSPDGFDHVFCHCLKIQEFWQSVTRTLHELTALPIPLTISVCLLGLVEELAPLRAQRTFLFISLFHPQKPMLLHWKKPEAPSLTFWKGFASYLLEQGLSEKVKVWHDWLSAMTTLGLRLPC